MERQLPVTTKGAKQRTWLYLLLYLSSGHVPTPCNKPVRTRSARGMAGKKIKFHIFILTLQVASVLMPPGCSLYNKPTNALPSPKRDLHLPPQFFFPRARALCSAPKHRRAGCGASKAVRPRDKIRQLRAQADPAHEYVGSRTLLCRTVRSQTSMSQTVWSRT